MAAGFADIPELGSYLELVRVGRENIPKVSNFSFSAPSTSSRQVLMVLLTNFLALCEIPSTKVELPGDLITEVR